MRTIKTVIFVMAILLSYASVYAQQNIYVNQVGYTTHQSKRVLTDYRAERFDVINTQTGQIAFQGEFKLRKTDDPCSGMTLFEGDFTALSEPGKYLVRVHSSLNSGITSFVFPIGEDVYTNVLNLANKALFLQRCGMPIEEQYAGVYARELCHTDDCFYHPNCTQNGAKNMTGGWHDAGDYGKYVAPGSVTIGILYASYELNKAKWDSDNWNIPESGNGLPDLLDEVIYELNWLFKMQRADGAVHEKVHTKDYVQFIMPSEGNVPQYIYEVSSTATADFAAIMAKSARIFKSLDPHLAEKCQKAALLSYSYLEDNRDIFPLGGFKNPADTKAGGYSDAYDKDERIWAAAEMYLLTGKKKYLKDFNELNTIFKSQFSEAGWINPTALGFYSILMADDKHLTNLQSELREGLQAYSQKHIEIAEGDGFGIGMKPDDFTWGSNGTVLFKAMNLVMAAHVLESKESAHLAAHHLDYIFGLNPNKISYVTGVGTNRILHLHHAPTVADLNAEPIPGILSGGPNKFRNDEALQKIFSEDTPPARVFVDNEESYSSNENTIYTNAALQFVATYFNR
ncbi:glycoside hydrolase family 9 protein [Carboxylicivirga sp. M1479]|uniref:glycoside hydrolase family 9 protein n=1 Tax=Carboxylicivirga sp. M1479 TaxID=2594476 RepID=UPI0011774C48|nr:glycoside hydrolase family 9 protein [Carboxylicivirga sp. M1479]TRX66136.1 glycoside hydrolase family 9 [Carboxylicivirga sp. M1479]